MNERTVRKIRETLRGGVTFQRATELRAKLEVYAEDYHAKNPPSKVLAFINNNASYLQLRKVHPTDAGVPFVYQLFTAKSQWVCGDSPAECFDKALKVKADWSNVSTADANALILAHQALKDARGEDTVQVAEVD